MRNTQHLQPSVLYSSSWIFWEIRLIIFFRRFWNYSHVWALSVEPKSIKIILVKHKHNVCTSRERSQYNSYTHDQLEVLLYSIKQTRISGCVSVCRFDGHVDQRRHSFHNSSSPRKRLQFTSADREDGKTEYSSSKLSFQNVTMFFFSAIIDIFFTLI